jgi:hypothetical protein
MSEKGLCADLAEVSAGFGEVGQIFLLTEPVHRWYGDEARTNLMEELIGEMEKEPGNHVQSWNQIAKSNLVVARVAVY